MSQATSKPTVLIVDDSPENIRALASALKGDYRQVAATSGPKAIEIAGSENRPDLILLDVMMPDMNGHEVCRRLKADAKTRDIPVIFITAMNEAENEARGFELGAVDYITKPFNPIIVQVRVRTHLELKEKSEIIRREREDLRQAYARLSETMELLQADIRMAADIQSMLLPLHEAKPFSDALSIVARYKPEMAVGGDFFDFKAIDGCNLGVILADVSGHGLQAAFVTGLIKTSFELAGEVRLRPAAFALNLNDTLRRLIPPSSFATMLYCVYDVQERTLRYLNSGHSPLPILVEPDGRVRPLSEESNMLLGILDVDRFAEEEFTIAPGSKLLLATDGLIDSCSPLEERFGYDRLTATVGQHAAASAHELDQAVFEALCQFTDGAPQPDDIAMLTLEFR